MVSMFDILTNGGGAPKSHKRGSLGSKLAEIDKVVTEHRKNAQIASGFYTPVIHGTASATACIFFVVRKR
jgi:hypothetical protein